MSAPTTKALADLIYDAFGEIPDTHDLYSEQLYRLARTAAETIEATGATKAIVRAWLEEQAMNATEFQCLGDVMFKQPGTSFRKLWDWASAIREVSS